MNLTPGSCLAFRLWWEPVSPQSRRATREPPLCRPTCEECTPRGARVTAPCLEHADRLATPALVFVQAADPALLPPLTTL